VFRENSNRANGLTFDHQGRLLTCEMTGRVTRTEKNGAISVLASEGLQAPNDLVYAIDGSIYFTDLPKSRVYQITRQGKLRPVAEDNIGPNGVTLSPNQQKLYVADMKGGQLREYAVTADGALGPGRVVCQVRGDGIKTDETGHIWVAADLGTMVFNAGGEHIGTIKTPEAPSNLSWGEGFRGLYITARTSVYHVPTKVPGTRTY
jgi:gluconolactonase